MTPHSSEAIILYTRNYGEADRIVTFFTADAGVCKGFARGARNSRKRFGPALEPFCQTVCFWSSARHGGDLLNLSEVELIDLRAGLRCDLATLSLAGYGCEVVEMLGGRHHNPGEIFALLTAFLDHLAVAGASAEARILLELRLLTLSGYAPHLLHCSGCNIPLTESAAFAASHGGALCRNCAPGAPPVAIGTLGALSRISRTPSTLFDGFRLGHLTLTESRRILSEALRLHLPHTPKSLALLDAETTQGGPKTALP